MSFKAKVRCIKLNPQADIRKRIPGHGYKNDIWIYMSSWIVLTTSNNYHSHPESKSGNLWTFSRSLVISTDWRPPTSEKSSKLPVITEVLGSIKSMARLVPMGQFNSLFKGSNNKSTCQVNLDYQCHELQSDHGRPLKLDVWKHPCRKYRIESNLELGLALFVVGSGVSTIPIYTIWRTFALFGHETFCLVLLVSLYMSGALFRSRTNNLLTEQSYRTWCAKGPWFLTMKDSNLV